MRARVAVVLGLLAGCGGDDPAPRVVISEVMYHPVLEGATEDHEFLELHNTTGREVALDGWTLSGEIGFTFPAGTMIPARGHMVVAKKRDALAAIREYGLDVAALAGDYRGELDNGGGTIVLKDAQGKKVDSLTYNDTFPWPLGADALGAGEDWLPPEERPMEKHRYRGRSLERVSVSGASNDVANWVASPLDGATPGRASGLSGPLPATLTSLSARPSLVKAADEVSIIASFTGSAGAAPRVEYFLEDMNRTDEDLMYAPMSAAPDGFIAHLPAQPDNTIVRYRILDDAGDAVSPRESDPYAWYSYFVSPETPGKTPAYHVFISMANWTRMFDNITPGRVPAGTCTPNPLWDAKVPAVLVSEGHVYDVRVRYQGSRFNRANGLAIDLTKWKVPMPPRPTPFRVLAWHMNFPRYDRLEGKGVFNFNKLSQSCQGFLTTVMNRLFESVGTPAARTKYVRLYVNGAYYHYTLRMEHMDEQMLGRFYGDNAPIGDLFKSVGHLTDEGPYGWGDERVLAPFCGYSKRERYHWTYKRMTQDHKDHSDEAMELVEALNVARAAGPAAIRRFFEERFDLDLLASYMAVINWGGPWDDFFQNHYLYRRPDGKWMMMPTDMDLMMGGNTGADASFFFGAFNIRSNREGWWNYLKDAYLRTFRQEFLTRLKELVAGPLSPASIAEMTDEAAADYVLDEAMAAPASAINIASCGGAAALVTRMKAFAQARSDRISQGQFD